MLKVEFYYDIYQKKLCMKNQNLMYWFNRYETKRPLENVVYNS